MPKSAEIWAIGLMSGTSCDGIDAALLRTDGDVVTAYGPSLTIPYDDVFLGVLRGCLGGADEKVVARVEQELTERHAVAVLELLRLADRAPQDVALVGFHGQTILHEPEKRRTWQIGDGALLAQATGIDVINDFRSNDVSSGGQGAPLAPVYHRALASGLEGPLAVLNLGGVGNVTWIGSAEQDLLAFDTGPANALIDDWALLHTGRAIDHGGALAKAGRVDEAMLARWLAHPYFQAPAPKSLDRDAFRDLIPTGCSPADGAATLTAFTAATVAAARQWFPRPAVRWLVTGGGRHNPVVMDELRRRLSVPVDPVEVVGWDGDALEAQAFAFMAVRSYAGLPISFPGTTGAPRPLSGGTLHRHSHR